MMEKSHHITSGKEREEKESTKDCSGGRRVANIDRSEGEDGGEEEKGT